jgi:dihydrofolate reductase
MRTVTLIVTTSLDGFLAEPDGGVAWLKAPTEGVPEEYAALLGSIDCLIMGRATYEVSLELPGGTDIFAGKEVYVFTSRRDMVAFPGVIFVQQDAVEFTRSLAARDGGTIWLFGGGKLATALSDAGLIDEYSIVVQPVLLGEGIPLWTAPHARVELIALDTREWPEGLRELRYRRA